MYIEDFLQNRKACDCIIVDEAQFLTKEQVEALANIVDLFDIPVI